MNKRKKITGLQRFSMVEVTLAMGVAAIGVIGAMALLPVALNSTSNSTSNTYLSDAATSIFAVIDAEVQQCKKNGTDEDFIKLFSTDDLGSGYETSVDAEYLNKQIIETLNKKNESDDALTAMRIWTDSKSGGMLCFFEKSKGDLLPDNLEANQEDKTSSEKIRYFKAPQPITLHGSKAEDMNIPYFRVCYNIQVTKIANHKGDEDYYDSIKRFDNGRMVPQITYTYDENSNELKREVLPGAMNLLPHRVEMTDEEEERCCRVYVEFSWPADRRYELRQKKYFVKEYYY